MAGDVEAELVGTHPRPGAGLAVKARPVTPGVSRLAQERYVTDAGRFVGQTTLETN